VSRGVWGASPGALGFVSWGVPLLVVGPGGRGGPAGRRDGWGQMPTAARACFSESARRSLPVARSLIDA
jgi:hypothetical protein